MEFSGCWNYLNIYPGHCIVCHLEVDTANENPEPFSIPLSLISYFHPFCFMSELGLCTTTLTNTIQWNSSRSLLCYYVPSPPRVTARSLKVSLRLAGSVVKIVECEPAADLHVVRFDRLKYVVTSI